MSARWATSGRDCVKSLVRHLANKLFNAEDAKENAKGAKKILFASFATNFAAFALNNSFAMHLPEFNPVPTARGSELSSGKLLHGLMTSKCILVVCFLLLCGISEAHAQQQVGYVIDFDGTWSVHSRGSLPITKGQSLPGGGTITVQSPSEFDYIVIADLKGKIIAHRRCRILGECDKPIELPVPPVRRGPISTAFGAVMSLLWGEPDRYSVHRARDGELKDGVVQLKGNQIDLRPIFAGRERGKYYLRLVPVARDAGKTDSVKSETITLGWAPNRASFVPLSGLQSGLYELVLLERRNDTYDPTDTTAWVLISPPKMYGRRVASYQQAVGLTKRWGSGVTPEAVRGFLRAYLDKLATTETERTPRTHRAFLP